MNHTINDRATELGGDGFRERYSLVCKIGRGGMADVFLAVNRGFGDFHKLVVLKAIRPEYANDPDAMTMFLDEARLAGRLRHPNVIQTSEVTQTNGRPLLVMEYLEGRNLSQILRRCRREGREVPLTLSLISVAEALRGLHYAHELSDYDGSPLHLVHRDVSAENIFVTYDGQVKVLDFGIAKAAISLAETRSGVIKGKLAYMSPEHVLGKPVDRRTDVYAMGAVLWRILTGRNLWSGLDQEQTLQRLVRGHVPAPSTLASNVDPDVEAICLRALSRAPEDRFATAYEMCMALERIIENFGRGVHQRDMGKLAAEVFGNERKRLRDIIEQRLTKLRGNEAIGNACDLGETPDFRASSKPPVASESPSNVDDTSSATEAATGAVQAARTKYTGFGIAAVGLAVCSILVGAAAYWVTPRPLTIEHAMVQESGAAVIASTASMISSAAKIACQTEVDVSPRDARMFVLREEVVSRDGVRLAPDALHELRFESPGYQPRTVLVRGCTDDRVAVSLTPASGPPSQLAATSNARRQPVQAAPRPWPKDLAKWPEPAPARTETASLDLTYRWLD